MELQSWSVLWVDKKFGKSGFFEGDFKELEKLSPSAFSELEAAILYAHEVLHGRAK